MVEDLRDCLAGEPAAWRAFVRRYGPVIHAAVRRVIAHRVREDSQQLCHDVVQDVFVRLVADQFALLRSYDPQRASLVTWLTIVARSTALDELRKRRLPTVPLDDLSDHLPGPQMLSAPAETPTADLPADLLSPRQALVMQLLFDQRMEVAAVATLLGVDEQTVRSTRHKALEKLRMHFINHPEK